MHPYLPALESWPEYEAIFRAAFYGMKRPNNQFSRNGLRVSLQNIRRSIGVDTRRVVVKTVFSLHNTKWISATFNPVVIVLLRNPYSLIHSIHRKWPDATLGNPEQCEALYDILGPYLEIMASARTPYEILATRVAAYYKIVLSDASKNPSWLVLSHEQLCADPVKEYRLLFDKVGLKWVSRVEEFLEGTNQPKKSDAVSDVNRVSGREIDKWRYLLSLDEISQIRTFYEAFEGLPYIGMLE